MGSPAYHNCYGYVGNNYERPLQFEKYYGAPSEGLRACGVQTSVYGNWLEKSPEREDPSVNIKKYPHISFHPRLDFTQSMSAVNSFICVTHITKDDYAKSGFISPRYFEALACSTPAFIPEELCINVLSQKGKDEFRVKNLWDIVLKVNDVLKLNVAERDSLVDWQRGNIKNFHPLFSVNNSVQFLFDLYNKLK
jgi:hypothetical protein